MFLVIPCYNEAQRLSKRSVEILLEDTRFRVLFVDDGSTDGTAELLHSLCQELGERCQALILPTNAGKAEAVRAGMREAIASGARYTGYTDADFSTPPSELSRLLGILLDSASSAVLGARISRLGAEVDRAPLRHYLGRSFATVASLILSIPIYDTQCGAKMFKVIPPLRQALSQPFSTNWSFDVELLGRLLTPSTEGPGLTKHDFVEVPLQAWQDVTGSKMGARGMIRGGLDLLTLGARVSRKGKKGFFPD